MTLLPQTRSALFALLAAMVIAPEASAALAQPESVELLESTKPDGEKECGIRADFSLSGSIMRVELSGAKTATGGKVYMRAYMPSSVGPAMRDIWLKTTSLYTLGKFRGARFNAQGIFESVGDLDAKATAVVIREIADGDAEVSLIFDGVLPAARLPLGLPVPLPPDIVASLNDCSIAFEK